MSFYEDDATPAEFDAGYANGITPEVVARGEAVFRTPGVQPRRGDPLSSRG